jgi:hypothetical protein
LRGYLICDKETPVFTGLLARTNKEVSGMKARALVMGVAALALVSVGGVGCSAKKDMERAEAAATRAEDAARRAEAAASRVEAAADRAADAAAKAEAILAKTMHK